MSFELPPIVKLSERVLLDIELTVRGFPRYHKYVVGSSLREQAMQITRLCHRAWRDKAKQPEWLNQLVFAIDDFKLTMQLAKQVHAFKSFAQFEHLARTVTDLGRQCGGWKKQQQNKGQNAQRQPSFVQRPEILSARSTSGEVML